MIYVQRALTLTLSPEGARGSLSARRESAYDGTGVSSTQFTNPSVLQNAPILVPLFANQIAQLIVKMAKAGAPS